MNKFIRLAWIGALAALAIVAPSQPAAAQVTATGTIEVIVQDSAGLVLPGVNVDEFESEMKARINDPRVTIERRSTPIDAGASRSDTPLFAAIRAAILKHHPSATVTPIFVPFGTDSVNLRRRGVIAYGLTPMILDTATAATMHSDRERIPVEEFKTGIRIYFDVLRAEI